MKNNKGITLISVVVTVVILFLISSITVSVGTGAWDIMRIENFVTNLKVVQSEVDIVAEETDDFSGYGFTPLANLQSSNPEKYNTFVDMLANPSEYNIDTSNSWDSTLDSNVNNYYYFENDDLEKIGLKNLEITVIINFKTRNVIAETGVAQDGKTYYRQYDLKSGNEIIK